MELESYFEFVSPDEIRVKGTRIRIETILEDYLEGASPEEIAVRYRSLTLEQVYASLLHYLQNQTQLDTYLQATRTNTEKAWLEQQQNPSSTIQRLRELKKQRTALLDKQVIP
jgi:uncharacterized protein (DUF433 family)